MRSVHRRRYSEVSDVKADGATYTPPELADFVAQAMLNAMALSQQAGPLRVLDPAVGEGQLLASLLQRIPATRTIEVFGFDSENVVLDIARRNLRGLHPGAVLHMELRDFHEVAAEVQHPLFGDRGCDGLAPFDLVIANPPYVRTQILGSDKARRLASRFGLEGRVDLYHAFVLWIAQVLRPDGVAGIIVSNRFMTTRAGASVRAALRQRFHLEHVWDLGDTKLFDAAVLPAVIVARGRGCGLQPEPRFTSIYQTREMAMATAPTVIAALRGEGVVEVADGRRFAVRQGVLEQPHDANAIWRVTTRRGEAWLRQVKARTWGTFRNLGKIRVGVKTCADKVFILKAPLDFTEADRPELLRPLTTHHVARRFRPDMGKPPRFIVYPHQCVSGHRRAVALEEYPLTREYLEHHRAALEARSYVTQAGRQWYEIWVPQDPDAWAAPKLVFRDITEKPCFWLDLDGTIVNGDCYWLTPDGTAEELLWLAAAVGNSSFIERFYDERFNNKLYAGRRRFITQYVEHFPIPDPTTPLAQEIIDRARQVYELAGTGSTTELEQELDRRVWDAFGLPLEEVCR